MPTLTCPVCADRYQVEFDQLADDPPCPRCARIAPYAGTELWKRPRDLDDMHVPFQVNVEPIQSRRGRGLILAVGIVAVLILGAAVAIGFALHARSGTSPEGAGRAGDGPWPECASCLQKIRENLDKQGIPNSLEGISWGQRRVVEKDNIAKKGNFLHPEGTVIERKGTVFIFVELRATNLLGQRESQTWQCVCENGRCIGCSRWIVPH